MSGGWVGAMYTKRYTLTIRMIGSDKSYFDCFSNREGKSHKTKSIDHTKI